MATEIENRKSQGKNSSERYVEIRNFRNVGITEPAKLVLNRSSEEGRMGDLVFLIGPNNSGKSNVIDAVESLASTPRFKKSDWPERGSTGNPDVRIYLSSAEGEGDGAAVSTADSRLHKHVLRKTQNEAEADAVESYILSGRYNFSDELDHSCLEELSWKSREELVDVLKSSPQPPGDEGSIACRLLVNSDDQVPVTVTESLDATARELERRAVFKDDFKGDVRFEPISDRRDVERLLHPFEDYFTLESISDFLDEDYARGEITLTQRQLSTVKDIVGRSTNSAGRLLENLIQKLSDFLLSESDSESQSLVTRILYQYLTGYSEYGGQDGREAGAIIKSVSCYDPFSKVVAEEKPEAGGSVRITRYVPNLNHSDRELRISLSNLDAPAMNLLSHVGITPEFVANKLDNLRRINNHPKDRRVMEKDMIDRMEPVSRQFNKLYGCTEGEYAIVPYLMDDCIDIRISKGEVPILLDNQSTGFKWFFDFFLSVICGNGLNPGDIVLMDEPATNLHVRGQAELREVMKRFAVENQVTFVISTHSPFLISCDYLDEVRIVSRGEDGFVRIENNFQAFDGDHSSDKSADQLDGVLSALTVGRHVIRDPGAPLVFVEGITDYNYLTAFAKLLGEDWISFMPVNGLRNENLGGKLRKIDRDPVILVDSDEAGYIARGKYGGRNTSPGRRVQVVTLEDVDPSFVGEYRFSDFNDRPEGSRGFTVEDLFSEKDRRKILEGRKESDFSSVFKSYIGDYGPMVSDETKDNFAKVFGYLRKEFLV